MLCLLAAEMTAATGKNPAELYAGLTERFGAPLYERADSPLDDAGRAALKALTPQDVALKDVAGSPVSAVLTHAPGNNAPIGRRQGSQRRRLVRHTSIGHRARLQGLYGRLPGRRALRRSQGTSFGLSGPHAGEPHRLNFRLKNLEFPRPEAPSAWTCFGTWITFLRFRQKPAPEPAAAAVLLPERFADTLKPAFRATP